MSVPRDDSGVRGRNSGQGVTRLQQIDQICMEFAQALRSGHEPRIEDLLETCPAAERRVLLLELLREELEFRKQTGELPDLNAVLRRFPDDMEIIEKAFRALKGGTESLTTMIPQAAIADTYKAIASETLAEEGSLLSADRYRKISRLGEGAFGAVWLAEDLELCRKVAIKEPKPDRVHKAADRAAYLSEARVVASLDHPHIVPVYDFGRTAEGSCYVVSKLIEGTNLQELMNSKKFSVSEIVQIISSMADALHHAHKRGLVHRDVKSANILIDQQGKPWLADFGIALKDQDIGQGPELVGTPAYMSPEQVAGGSHRVDGRTDIYSLGVVLYELLTGRRPFRADDRVELFKQIQTMEPKPPRQIDDGIPVELERICLKALSRSIKDRYSTAKDFASELRAVTHPPSTVSEPRSAPRTILQWTSTVRSLGCSVTIVMGILVAVGSAGKWAMNKTQMAQQSVDTYPSDFQPPYIPDKPMEITGLPDTPPVQQPLVRNFVLLASREKQTFRPAADLVPLQTGDHVRFTIEFNEPVYARLIWIDAEGRAEELFPEDPAAGHRGNQPVTKLESPGEFDRGWPLQGSTGTETALLLVSRTPLADLPLYQFKLTPHHAMDGMLICNYKAEKLTKPVISSVLYEDNGETRSLGHTPEQINDPIPRLLELLRSSVDEVQAICVVHRDEVTP